MILLRQVELPAHALGALATYQAEVDAADDYAARVEQAKDQFSSRNRKGQAVFDQVKEALTAMCAGVRRCVYCEDSLADEVEHIRPKDLYPEQVFAWPNYVYACGPCNGPKNNRFAVMIEGETTHLEITRKRGQPIEPPPPGDPAFLDPRVEDATKLMCLDLKETFRFIAIADKGSRDHTRVACTIDILDLNRELMVAARRDAFKDYSAHLSTYVTEKQAGASPEELAEIQSTICSRQHPTVWREMQRQRDMHPKLQQLFQKAPEAATWRK